MIDDRDPETRNLIAVLQPGWTRVRLRRSHGLSIKERVFSCSSIVFDDGRSLLCSVGSHDFRDLGWDYFPFRCDLVSDSTLHKFEYVTLASKGGSSELDRKLQWLFETPTSRSPKASRNSGTASSRTQNITNFHSTTAFSSAIQKAAAACA